jgi:nicotinate-nucleotide adenylyltransferase
MKRYGIMGGTFDPIHIGHLFIAEEIRCRFKLDKIIFVPNGNPPHKEGVTDKHMRFEMVKMAIADNPNFEISSIEMQGDERIYTIDTIKRLREVDSENDYYFIFGSDSLYDLHKWRNYRELLGLCRFIAIGRPGFKTSDMELPKEYMERIEILNTIEIPIDSTNIRRRVRNSENIKYLVKPEVEQYIADKKIYKRGEI